MRRILATLIVAILLAGCQQPGDAEGTRSATARDGEDLRFFQPEFSAVMDHVIAKLRRACTGVVDEVRLDSCVRDQFASAFDDSRQGRRNCDVYPDLAGFMSCVATGNMFLDIRHRLSDDSPVPATFWTEEGAMSDALVDTMVANGLNACGLSSVEDRTLDCVMAWFEKKVELPAELARRCDGQVDKERYGCVIEAVMLRYMQDHVPNLGAVNT